MGPERVYEQLQTRYSEDPKAARSFRGLAMTFECALCGRSLGLDDEEFRWVTLTTSEGFKGHKDAPAQDFACHRECLSAKLGDSIPLI